LTSDVVDVSAVPMMMFINKFNIFTRQTRNLFQALNLINLIMLNPLRRGLFFIFLPLRPATLKTCKKSNSRV